MQLLETRVAPEVLTWEQLWQIPNSGLVYIAGPYRASASATILEHVRTAERAAIALAREGLFYVYPHMNSAFICGVAPDAYFLALGLELLNACSAMLLLPGWRSSEGTCAEYAAMLARGCPIYELSLKENAIE